MKGGNQSWRATVTDTSRADVPYFSFIGSYEDEHGCPTPNVWVGWLDQTIELIDDDAVYPDGAAVAVIDETLWQWALREGVIDTDRLYDVGGEA